jgi:hypothetical protein
MARAQHARRRVLHIHEAQVPIASAEAAMWVHMQHQWQVEITKAAVLTAKEHRRK